MAGPSILFELHAEPPIEGMRWALDRTAENVADFGPLLEGFGEIFRGHMQRQFASEGSLAGGWAALSPAYEAWKTEHYPGRPIGVLRGHLRSAMTGGAGYDEQIRGDSASYGMGAASPARAYAKYFAGGGRGPARPVVKWGAEESRAYQKYSHEWLLQAVEMGAGRSEPRFTPSVRGVL